MKTKQAKNAMTGIGNLYCDLEFTSGQIIELIEKNNLSIKSFALISNTTPLVVSSWIRGETKPCGSSRRLMQLLSISPQWIDLLFFDS